MSISHVAVTPQSTTIADDFVGRSRWDDLTAEAEIKASEREAKRRQRMYERTLAAGLDPAEFLLAA